MLDTKKTVREKNPEKCPECGETIDLKEDRSYHCHQCGNVGILE